MKLLIITQKVDKNDDVLGFMHRWIEEFAKHYEFLTVVCLDEGEYDLPKNVIVFSLGKEQGVSKFRYVLNFYKYIWQERNNYDAVFVHMNQEYVLMGGFIWKMLSKKILFWRNHPMGNFLTNFSVFLSNIVFCASPFAYTARFKKTKVMPVGIDTDKFSPNTDRHVINNKIVYVGRISPIKYIELIIEAIKILNDRGVRCLLEVYGKPVPRVEDTKYFEKLKKMVNEGGLKEQVIFNDPVPNSIVPGLYRDAALSVNVTTTGSMDKTIFEAMACGVPVVTSNQAMLDSFPELVCLENNPIDLAEKIDCITKMNEKGRLELSRKVRGYIQREHSIDLLVGKIDSFVVGKQ